MQEYNEMRIDPDYRSGDFSSRSSVQEDLVWFRGIKMTPDVIRSITDISKQTAEQYIERYGKDWGKYLSGELIDPNRKPVSVVEKFKVKPKQKPRRPYGRKLYNGLTLIELAKKYNISKGTINSRYQKGLRGADLVRELRTEVGRYVIKNGRKKQSFSSIPKISDYLHVSRYRVDKAIHFKTTLCGYLITKEKK